jgi:thymidylate synthase ThyX
MEVEVILASAPAPEFEIKPIYTIRARYPRIIHAELLTHRTFSRNARSSRAVPVNTMLKEVSTDPFVPWHWGTNQKGMQAGEELTDINKAICIDDWREAADKTCLYAAELMAAGVHKQIPNRLLEPFSYIDTLITSTEWENFFWLRNHKDAEPHLQDLAKLMQQAIAEAPVQEIPYRTGWHLPYVSQEEIDTTLRHWAMENEDVLSMEPDKALQRINILAAKISAARCARISYKPFDGNASYERELERFDSLVTSDRVHASPLEHQAFPIQNTIPELVSNLTGYVQFRKLIPNETRR